MSLPWLPPSVWTEERTQRLRDLAAEGLCARLIAEAMGGVSKNSIIGRCYRQHIQLLGNSTANRSRKRKLSPKSRKRAMRPFARSRLFRPPVADGLFVEPPSDSIGRNIPLVDLQPADCRWPNGDPQSATFGFCGDRRAKDFPYCEHHCRLAYVCGTSPLEQRRARERAKRQANWSVLQATFV